MPTPSLAVAIYLYLSVYIYIDMDDTAAFLRFFAQIYRGFPSRLATVYFVMAICYASAANQVGAHPSILRILPDPSQLTIYHLSCGHSIRYK